MKPIAVALDGENHDIRPAHSRPRTRLENNVHVTLDDQIVRQLPIQPVGQMPGCPLMQRDGGGDQIQHSINEFETTTHVLWHCVPLVQAHQVIPPQIHGR